MQIRFGKVLFAQESLANELQSSTQLTEMLPRLLFRFFGKLLCDFLRICSRVTKEKKKVCLTQFHIRNSQHKSALAREELRKNVIERFHDKSSRLIVETGTLCFLGGKFVCSNYSFRPRTSLEIRFSYTKKKKSVVWEL